MKKTILRIFATATTLISLFFIIFLILTAFGKITVEEFDNSIVRTICLVLGSIFVALSATSHVLLYLNDDAVKEIILRSDKDGTAKTSLSVIKKITKNTIKTVDGVKCTKCAVISNDFGIRLKVWIAVKERDMKETEELVRAYLEDAFWGALEFRFFAIDINLKKIKAKHVIDKAGIEAKLEEKKEETVEEESSIEEKKEETLPVEEVVEEAATEEVAPETVVAVESEIDEKETPAVEEPEISEESVKEEVTEEKE